MLRVFIFFRHLFHVNVIVVFMELLPAPEVQKKSHNTVLKLVNGLYLGCL